jgi:hypothetical protein
VSSSSSPASSSSSSSSSSTSTSTTVQEVMKQILLYSKTHSIVTHDSGSN